MKHMLSSGRIVGLLIGVSLFVIAPFTVSAFWSGFPFGGGGSSGLDREAFPAKLCPSTIRAAGISVPVFLPCKKETPPPPIDKCPNVPGTQTSLPCADDICEDNGGNWDGDSCEMPPPTDVCPNVPGNQTSGPCADQVCQNQGGTWDGDSCEMPPPLQPILDFSANPVAIEQGNSSTLTWDSTNATACVASNGWSGSRAVDGTQIVTPSATTTYQLECAGAGGTTTKSVTIGVTSAPPPPVDVCPYVPGTQTSGPCADQVCQNQGGTWDGDSCEFPPPQGKLLITEVLYDLTTSTTSPQGSETANEWVEIYNGTNSSVNLSEYNIADASSTDMLPDVVVPAGKFAVIVASSTTTSFWNIPGDAVVAQLTNTTIGNGLGNAGDAVYLILKVSTTTVDSVSWGTNTTAFSPSVPLVGANKGHSMARTDITVDTDTAADWAERTLPNPGQ